MDVFSLSLVSFYNGWEWISSLLGKEVSTCLFLPLLLGGAITVHLDLFDCPCFPCQHYGAPREDISSVLAVMKDILALSVEQHKANKVEACALHEVHARVCQTPRV